MFDLGDRVVVTFPAPTIVVALHGVVIEIHGTADYGLGVAPFYVLFDEGQAGHHGRGAWLRADMLQHESSIVVGDHLQGSN